MTTKIPVQLLKDHRLIVWDHSHGNILFNAGFYGKPLGIPKPREEFHVPLILDAVEGTYLQEKGKIIVKDKNEEVSREKLLGIFSDNIESFQEKLGVYRELRDYGYIVTPGIKYGCDFAVYEKGPGIDHAPYVIQIQDIHENLSAPEIVKAGRLATSVRKSFLIAVVGGPKTTYLEFNWWKA